MLLLGEEVLSCYLLECDLFFIISAMCLFYDDEFQLDCNIILIGYYTD